MGYIFESEIESIIHAVRIRTIGEDDDILLKRILAANIHPAIKAYFKAEVEKMLAQERAAENRSKRFSYSLAEIKSLEEQIDLLLIQNYHFSQQEFESLLDESVHFQFNYLCRPQWTLLNFIIGDQRKVPSSMIEKKLKYCVDYTYFPSLIKRYLSDHGLAEVTYEEFKSLIERIDCSVVAQHSSLELAHMTRALFEFVESGKMVPQLEFEQQTLPINAAIVFFEDKGITDIRVRLEFERDRNGILQVTVDCLADIIEAVRTGKEETTTGPVISLWPIKEEVQNEEEEQPLEDRTFIIPEDAQRSKEAEPEVQIDAIDIQQPPPPVVEGEDDTYHDQMPNTEQNVLLDIFSEDEGLSIIKKIFKDDETAFHGAMIEIGYLIDWEDAAQYLDKLFLANEADPFCAEAVLFTDKLYARFHPPDAKK
jgi:hypothetical protein